LLLTKYYNVCLFDDHGVDDIQKVTMANWQSGNNRRVLIVHGTSEKEDGDSHVTMVHIPKLGCLDCKQLRDDNSDDSEWQKA
jgi:DDB1- and CUL4-associated factor 15